MEFLIIKGNAYNNKLLLDLILAIITISYTYFILRKLFIYYGLDKNPHEALIISLILFKPEGFKLLLETSYHYK